jgi:protein disulfide-isomerase
MGWLVNVSAHLTRRRVVKKSTRWLYLILIASGVVFAATYYQPNDRIPWRSDYAAATIEAKKAGKPLLVYFTADWCNPCQMLKSTTFADRGVAEAVAKFIPVKLNVDDKVNAAMALSFHDQDGGIPYFAVVDDQGQLVHTAEGALPADLFVKWLAGNSNIDQ